MYSKYIKIWGARYTPEYVVVRQRTELYIMGSTKFSCTARKSLISKSISFGYGLWLWCLGTVFLTEERTCARYMHILQTFMGPKLEQLNGEIWFPAGLRDGSHFKSYHLGLEPNYSPACYSNRGNLSWPLHLSDLAPWSYLKEKVFETCPETIDILKEAIHKK